MLTFSGFSSQHLALYLRVVRDSLHLKRHKDLFEWLQGDVQTFLPHEILIAAWGDFSLGLLHLDVMSSLPGLRTTEVDRQDLLPILLNLFSQWEVSVGTPLLVSGDSNLFNIAAEHERSDLERAMLSMRSALVHGIKDQRGRHDCLYIALSSSESPDAQATHSMAILLPYIDAALRQVAHLPVQYPDLPVELEKSGETDTASDGNAWGLSDREFEIMHWVRMGKTNTEIGRILDISFFTVKNHLQRIFRKLDVLNRAQAVAKFERQHNGSRD